MQETGDQLSELPQCKYWFEKTCASKSDQYSHVMMENFRF